MLQTTVTHYYPWNDPDDVAWCGATVTAATHSLTPTCATCAAKLAIEDAVNARLADEAVIELTDDDARYAGEVVVTPTVAAPAAARLADDLFTFAVALTRLNAAAARGGRR